MPDVRVTIDGIGHTKQISAADYKRLLDAMRHFNVVTSWSDDDGVMHYPTDRDIIQGWANDIVSTLNRWVELREDELRERAPPLVPFTAQDLSYPPKPTT